MIISVADPIWPDVINGLFLFVGALVICLSIKKLYIQGQVRGIDWRHPAFFNFWGMYQLFFYANLEQWFSFAAAITTVLAGTTYLLMILFQLAAEKQDNDT